MRTLICAGMILPFTLAAQTAGTCANPFEAAAMAGREIAMNLRSGDIKIVGRDAPGIRVSCMIGNWDGGQRSAGEIKISFAAGHLTIRGGSGNAIHLHIEIPRSTNLVIRAAAGNLSLSGVTGDKDIELNAGNLTIDVGKAADYRHAEASMLAGNLSASVFGVTKDGLFRSFKTDSAAGKYRLRVQLLAGDLILR
jgi:hypothetical protein